MNQSMGILNGANNRKPGAIQPSNYKEEKKTSNNIKKSKRKTSNQKHTIKISDELYQHLKIVKDINNEKFDYQAIELLIDNYINNAPEGDRKLYQLLDAKNSK
ncbi:hypothetical protein [Apilactobacillus timberlakei]|uniref:hypothetical protein n=1 Tax=Apilactobacillus timberlakei TaxID=2008380 RepID=UPI000D045E25|nr:hypothetical protein [Apilactobacillus timberlakei]TPR13666.1 hypothetical protein DY052_08040 [Apilactobacillus timberlakei]